jgi:hypothetical protein
LSKVNICPKKRDNILAKYQDSQPSNW